MAVCVRPARGLWTATPPHNLEGLSHHHGSAEEEEHQTASAASKQPPADLLSIFSESEVRLTPFLSLLSSFPLCRQIQLLNDRRVRPPASFLLGEEGEETLTLLSPSESQSGLPIGKREAARTHASLLPRLLPSSGGLGQFIWSSGREGG